MGVISAILLVLVGIAVGGALAWMHRGAQIRVLETRNEHSREKAEEYRQALERERVETRRMLDDSDRRWALKLDSVKQELLRVSADALASRQSSLQETNRLQISELLQPIRQTFTEFRQSIEATRTHTEVSKRSIQATFESTLKLFQQQQQQAVTQLLDATTRIGNEADNLSKALKSDTKKQGNWGEMVLESILANCGLRKDSEYFVQMAIKDKYNKVAYPDVVVRFPEGRCVVIDSKVSLTSYAEAVATDDEQKSESLLREHVKSVRRHIDELCERDYTSIVDDAIGYVLMFIPNESAYIAAIKQDPNLSAEAYAKRVIIISPSNLLMALQLAHNLWQYDRQTKNTEKIIATASDLYDKVVGFEDAFIEVDTRLGQLRTAYDTARNRLYSGRGSVIDRVNALKSLGITPKKRIKGDPEGELPAVSQ